MNTRSIKHSMKNRMAGIVGGAALGLIGAYALNRFAGYPYSYGESNGVHSDFLANFLSYLYNDPLKKVLMTLTGGYIGHQVSQFAESKDESHPAFIEQQPMNYSAWQKLLKDERLPAAIIDLDAFDRNVAKLAEIAGRTGKTVRIATKSIRVPDLILRVLDSGPPFRGLMCYTAEEAWFLHTLGNKIMR